MRNKILAGLLFGMVLSPAFADVADSGTGGFTVKVVTNIKAPPAEVYRRLVRNVGEWWNSTHTFSHDAHNLSMEDRAMGCFCEKLANGGSVRHMEVVYANPGTALRLIGAIGPLQGLAVTGAMTFDLSAADGGTKLEVTYAVGGYMPGPGMAPIAAPTDQVLADQCSRLKHYIEDGKPTAKN